MVAFQLMNCAILFLSLLTQDLTRAAKDVPRTTYSLWSISGGGLGTEMEEEEQEQQQEVNAILIMTLAVVTCFPVAVVTSLPVAVVLCSDATRGS